MFGFNLSGSGVSNRASLAAAVAAEEQTMSLAKRRLIDEIEALSESPTRRAFLIQFDEADLEHYRRHLALRHEPRNRQSRWVREPLEPAFVMRESRV